MIAKLKNMDEIRKILEGNFNFRERARRLKELKFEMIIEEEKVAMGQTKAKKSYSIHITYQDGFKEFFRATWEAKLDVHVREDGHPAIPLEGKLVDNRRCSWAIQSAIERQFGLLSRSGEFYPNPKLSKAYFQDFRNNGNALVILNGFRPENCEDCKDRRNSDISNAERDLVSAFPELVDADLELLKAELRQDGQVTEIVCTPIS